MTNKTTESWDGFSGENFLKASEVKSDKEAYVVTGVEVFTNDDDDSKPRLTLENSGKKATFDLNVTNSNFCKNNGIATPKSIIGKKIYFKKVNVMSPKTKSEVESLRICKIE